jgi:radical SAM-linked protein
VRAAYSEGFSPRPRLSFGLALSTGYESLGEYLDIDLADELDPRELPGVVTPSLPQGLEAQASIAIPPGTDSLQEAVTSSSWHMELTGPDPAGLMAEVERVLAAGTLPITVERKGSPSQLDARPAILALHVVGSVLHAELATHPRSLRPAELVRALEPSWKLDRVLRTHQWTMVDGARREPIPLGDLDARGATLVSHAGARAS